MAREYGEAFQKPVDIYTGAPIEDAPRMGRPTTTRPNGNGHVVLQPEPAEMENTRPSGYPMLAERIDQPRVVG